MADKTVVRFTHIPKTAGTSLDLELRRRQYIVPGSHAGQERCFQAPGLCGQPMTSCRGACGIVAASECNKTSAQYSGMKLVDLVMFREPREHVYSLYMQCRYSIWGRYVTGVACNLLTGSRCANASSQFEALFVRNHTDASGFRAWVQWFAHNFSKPVDAFGCYNPRNMQSRVLTCSSAAISGARD